ncbi:MAG: DNA mismatch repair protein MutS, partial [Gammaproteobacteria bacterium]|nr:DNA mismatch repair protein MutS [Gammaproteobacteria bacterium]
HYFELTALADELPACRNVHLDATEHEGRLVFLHAVKPGPANQSYGLQVAALAGVPRHVVQRARDYLATLESHQVALTQSPQAQLPLGPAADDEDDGLRDALEELDPDAMTPLQALEALYKLKDL